MKGRGKVVDDKIEVNEELFIPIENEEKKIDEMVRPSISYWKYAWRRLKENKVALVSLVVIIIVVVVAIIIPMISPYGYAETNHTIGDQAPNLKHIFGTDTIGRDILVRCMYGTRYSLIIAVSAALINLVIGVLLLTRFRPSEKNTKKSLRKRCISIRLIICFTAICSRRSLMCWIRRTVCTSKAVTETARICM